MCEPWTVSRRTSLKSLGVWGAAMVFDGVAEAAEPPDAAKLAQSGAAEAAVNPVELAAARFGNKHTCAQAVFSAFAEPMGLDYQAAVKLTTGFGGGMGLGSICGAVTGAIMAMGLKFGGLEPEARERTQKLVREFVDRFKAQRPSLMCRDLLGADLSTPDGYQAAKEKKLFAVCPGIVTDAAKILQELLNEDDSVPS